MLEKYKKKFLDIGSELLSFPKKNTDSFIFKCRSCGNPETYLGISTFFNRKSEPLCKKCQKIEAAKKKIQNARNKAILWIKQSGAELLDYSGGIQPVTLKCAGCNRVFTYSSYSNLKKRNKHCLCPDCFEIQKNLQNLQEHIKYFEKEFLPLLKKINLQITQKYPVDKETAFFGKCSKCLADTLFPPINTFLFYLKKDPLWRPICYSCIKKQIGITQKQKNSPTFLKKARKFFKDNGSKLINKPKSSKSKFTFICSNCKKIATRNKLYWFQQNLNNFICPDCNRKAAGEKRRVASYKEGQKKTRKNLFEYYNTWVRTIRKRWKKTCVISGSKEKIVVHHIYGFTRHPELAENFFNGVCLTDSLHKEFHARYGRKDFNYFDFQEFYKEKTGRDFYLYQDNKTIIDIVKTEIDVLARKKDFAKITYIPLFEHELFQKGEILESILKAKLHMLKLKVFARECKVIPLSYKEVKSFLLHNHRQGTIVSSFNYGLKHPELGLVAVMTFGKPRFTTKYDFELFRFCSLKGMSVVGAASKLFKHFTLSFPGKSIISYCDLRFSALNPSDTVYSKIGFKYFKTTKPNFFYFKEGKVFSRIKFQKHKLPSLLKTFDPQKTEKENMLQNGYSLYYDCGNHVFVFPSVQGK